MPTNLRVLYRRTFSHAPYESQTIELEWGEDMTNNTPEKKLAAIKKMYQDLEEVGDALMMEALNSPQPTRRKS